jgi:hypothetical protein
MFPAGHLLFALVPVCVYVVLRDRQLPSPHLIAVVGFGSQFPDLIDKPLHLESHVIVSGRVGTHSLPIAIPIALAVIWYARKTERFRGGLAFVFAYGTHIYGDVRHTLFSPDRNISPDLFWPLTEPVPRPETPFWAGPDLLYVHVWTVVSITAISIAGILLLRDIAHQSDLLPR